MFPYDTILTGKIKNKYSSLSVAVIVQGAMLDVKLILINSSSIFLIHSLIYLALKAIVISLPSNEIVMFSVTLPISDWLESVNNLSLTSNLTRLYAQSLKAFHARS